MAMRIIMWAARIAGAGTMILGWLSWVFQLDIISVHIAFGLVFALALAVLGLVLARGATTRGLGAIGFAYALFMPAFGLMQGQLLVSNLHWLIQTSHLLVGIGGIILAQTMTTRHRRVRRLAAATVSQTSAIRVIRS